MIPRDLRLEVPERMDAQGRILTPLDEGAQREALLRLADQDCESPVVHFLHSYANPAHEFRAAEIAAQIWPTPYITRGHALLSESRAYERGGTAAAMPRCSHCWNGLAGELAARGYARDLLVMNGNGGMVAAGSVARVGVKTVMSGPASGVMAAIATGRRAGVANLLTFCIWHLLN